MKAVIRSVRHHAPEGSVSNEELAALWPGWTPEKIVESTGFRSRRVAGPDVCASDLAERAARKLFESGEVDPAQIDLLLFCTQGPDYLLPATACLLQDR